jgi:hypothetical protein
MRVASLDKNIRLGAHNKEGRAECEDEEPLKIDIASVHNVKRTCFRDDLVQDVYIVYIATGDANERGNVAVQVQQSMHLDGGLAPTKLRPRE